MKNMKRSIAVVVAVALMLGCAIGGTLAWLSNKSEPITNIFTTSDINIVLEETDNLNLKMVPGGTITKDPQVTVETGSEPCWLFVKIDKTNDYDTYMTHGIMDDWTVGNGTNIPANVYYRKVDTADMGQPINIIYYDVNNNSQYDSGEENKVFVNTSVRKNQMEAAKNNAPTLTFTAYATQLMKDNTSEFTAIEAWSNIESEFTVTTP